MFGARRHYAVPKLLHRSGLLGRLYTDAYQMDPLFRHLIEALPSNLRPDAVERFLARFDEELPSEKVVSFNTLGAWYYWKRRTAGNSVMLERIHATAARRFNRSIASYGLADTDVVYGYNGASVELFRYARAQGVGCLLDQTIAPQMVVDALLSEEAERWPGWEPGLTLASNGILVEREREEWQLADLIIAGSRFVVDGLRHCGVPGSKCRVLPYGVSLEQYDALPARRGSAKLKLLFAGEVGLRKGVPYLLQALRWLNSNYIEARFVGPLRLTRTRLRDYSKWSSFVGPVPRSRMAEVFRWADLLVLPSICEGSALVIYEALVSGLPVIVTPNTGAPVAHGLNGLIVPARDVAALASAVDRFASDRAFLQACSQEALALRSELGLDAYRARLVEGCTSISMRESSP